MSNMNPANARTVRDLVDIPPEVLALAHRKALELYQKGQLDEAEVLLKGVIAVDEKDAWAHALYGSIRSRQARYPEALELLGSAVRLAPDNEQIKHMCDELRAFLIYMATKPKQPQQPEQQAGHPPPVDGTDP